MKNKITRSSTLKQMQVYTQEMNEERGFAEETIPEKIMLMIEEVGELCKAIRKNATSVKSATDSKNHNIQDEFADVMLYIMALANKCGIDLTKAVIEKEKENAKRTWQ